jgi:hypothetical protein
LILGAFFLTAYAQTEDIETLDSIVSQSTEIGNFFIGCTNMMYTDPSVITECMDVANDFKQKLDEMYTEH